MQDMYESTIHVPLIIRHPQLFPKGKRIEALVQLIDIPYLILELLEVPIPNQFQGRSLKSLIYGEAEDIYSEIYSNQGLWSCKRTIITKDGWKLIKTIDQGFWNTPSTELFNLKNDPKEKHNLADEEKDLADHLELKMNKWLEENLNGKPDPLRLISSAGLPPMKWIKEAGEAFTEKSEATYEEWRKMMGY